MIVLTTLSADGLLRECWASLTYGRYYLTYAQHSPHTIESIVIGKD